MAVLPPALADAGVLEGSGGPWIYQLSGVDPAAIAASPADLAVLDPTVDGSWSEAWPAAEVAAMQRRPDGGRRVLLAYLSIGEAEDYRDYWRPEWSASPPAWLGEENPDWPGNYTVRYWEPGWQACILGAPDAPLDRILAAGWDGVYLDIVDAFERFEDARPGAAEEMVDWVGRVAAVARERKPGFLVCAQNGERLLERPEYRGLLDAVAKEDLWYGMEEEEEPSPAEETAESLDHLRAGREAGLAVLTVDYVAWPGQVADALARSRAEGFRPTTAVRELDRLALPSTATVRTGRPRRPTPGQFFAGTLPAGAWRVQLGAEAWTERLDYRVVDGTTGVERGYRAARHGDGELRLALTRGLAGGWEAELALPWAVGLFEPATADRSEAFGAGSRSGLGEVGLALRRGWKRDPWVAVAGLGLALPFDSRDEPYGSGAGALLAGLELEREIGEFGLESTWSSELELDGGGVWSEGGLACGFEPLDRVYFSAGGSRSNQAWSVALDAEWVLGRLDSIEASWGAELTGAGDGRWLGITWVRRLR